MFVSQLYARDGLLRALTCSDRSSKRAAAQAVALVTTSCTELESISTHIESNPDNLAIWLRGLFHRVIEPQNHAHHKAGNIGNCESDKILKRTGGNQRQLNSG